MGQAERQHRDQRLFDRIDEVLYGHEQQHSIEQMGAAYVPDCGIRRLALGSAITFRDCTFSTDFELEMVGASRQQFGEMLELLRAEFERAEIVITGLLEAESRALLSGRGLDPGGEMPQRGGL